MLVFQLSASDKWNTNLHPLILEKIIQRHNAIDYFVSIIILSANKRGVTVEFGLKGLFVFL